MALSRQAARGRASGIAVGAVIGSGWAIYAARTLAPGDYLGIVLAATIAAVLVAWAIASVRALGSQADTAPASGGARARRLFLLNTVGEIVALNIVVYALARFGWMAYLIPGIAVVVGLHFLPMARFFVYPLFYWTGGIMIAAALAAAAVIHAGTLPSTAGGIDAVANALILWGTAAVGLLALDRQRATGSIAR